MKRASHPSSHWLFASRPRKAGAMAGFTIIELMITVALLAVLAALAAPSFSQLIANQRAKGTATDLYLALTKARSEAIKLNTNVTLAPKVANQWQAGWTISYLDENNVSVTVEDHGPVSNATITGASVVYSNAGRIKNATAPAIAIAVSGGNEPRCVSTDLSGRPYLKQSSC